VDLGEVGFGVVIGFVWLRIGTSGGLLLHRNEHSGSIKDGKFVDFLSVVLAFQEEFCFVELVIQLQSTKQSSWVRKW
jgi:hypothetical protein